LVSAWTAYALPAATVTPVPLSVERQRERGYNQAALLARAFAELAGLPYDPLAARRVRHTETQVRLTAEARRRNVQGAFRGRPERVAGRTIILVDDITTTGATLMACAEALTTAGAAAVWGLTLGRAVGHASYSAAAGPPVATRAGARGPGRLQT
jgi:ComF family protein